MNYLCLHCEHLFKAWKIFEQNNAEICPICGISEHCGQYEVIIEEESKNAQ